MQFICVYIRKPIEYHTNTILRIDANYCLFMRLADRLGRKTVNPLQGYVLFESPCGRQQ
jgi:hypothetical protein